MLFELPHVLQIDGRDRPVNTDYRDILNILAAFNDPDIGQEQKAHILLFNLFEDDYRQFEDAADAYKKAVWFIDGGREFFNWRPSIKIMDWEQDFPIIIPPINRIAGTEIRELKYLHWWTFLSYYMEIGDCTFANVVRLREKLRKNQKIEKYEQDFLRNNRDMVMLKDRLSDNEKAQEAELFGYWGDR